MFESKIVGLCFLVFILTACLFVISSFLTGCDFRENAVIREQTDIFTDEIREKNKDMQLLANQLKIAQEQNKRLELMLLCREDQIDEKVDQAKKDSLKENPILISINKTPEKSNKTQKEREGVVNQ
tara:strand:- start:4896 stop:5273 length:378 start_codon:yes stop_codon:yes gene_type:complete